MSTPFGKVLDVQYTWLNKRVVVLILSALSYKPENCTNHKIVYFENKIVLEYTTMVLQIDKWD